MIIRVAGSIMVIRLSADDCESPIDLLNKEQTHHLVAESHLRERYLSLSSLIDTRRKAVRATDEQDKTLRYRLQFLLHPLAEVAAGHLLAAFVEKDQLISTLQTFQHLVGFAFLLLLFAQCLGVLQIGDFLNLKGDIMTQALSILIDQARVDIALGPTREQN